MQSVLREAGAGEEAPADVPLQPAGQRRVLRPLQRVLPQQAEAGQAHAAARHGCLQVRGKSKIRISTSILT